MPRYIIERHAQEAMSTLICDCLRDKRIPNYEDVKDALLTCPTADVVERKAGKWTEKEVICAEEAKTAIDEWQSCRCSVCGRYDTRPYMYYFIEPHFCSWCGAEMKGEEE